MEYLNNKSILNEHWELINEVISTGGEFNLVPNGVSMLPLIRPGVDTVVLALPNGVKVNDIVLYKRENDKFVLHRVIEIKNDEYIMCGDNQFRLEYGIKKDNILAKVVYFERDGKKIDDSNERYRKYIKRLPSRRRRLKLRSLLGRIKRKLIKKK